MADQPNIRQLAARKSGMAEKAAQQLEAYFPDVPEEFLWLRKKNQGFTTLPRTMPIIMQIIDNYSKNQPAGHTYFSLWCRAPDHPLITIENPIIFAAEAGFSGVRAVDTWRRRMKTLQELGFIRTRKGASGDFHYVLLRNPNMAVEHLHLTSDQKIQEELYSKFFDRILEIGAGKDIQYMRDLVEKHKTVNEDNEVPKKKPRAKKIT
jgi:hypothetical protein